jgi:hypothetical protein
MRLRAQGWDLKTIRSFVDGHYGGSPTDTPMPS